MIKTVHINTLDEVKNLLFEQTRNEQNGRYRSSYFYRGLPNKDYSLITSLKRNCGSKSALLEQHLLDNFTKYASIEDPTIDDSVWKAMIVGQHHGLPTRLLDWTHSTLVALHFANAEIPLSDLDKTDCAIWRIDAREINRGLPESYKNALVAKSTFVFSVANLSEVTNSISEYDQAMGNRVWVTLEPPSIDQRIVNQYSFFSVIPSGISDIEAFLNENTNNTVKYVIDKCLRWDLRDILDQMNMNERMIYPGLDGIAKWIARHYFVRE